METENSTVGYSAIICGGINGIAARIIGSKPRKFKRAEVKRVRRILEAGYSVEIVMRDRATWRAHGPGLLAQLGVRV